jgi:hypothetical protein
VLLGGCGVTAKGAASFGRRKMKLGKIAGFLIDSHPRQLLRKTDRLRFQAVSSPLDAIAVRESKDKQVSAEEVSGIR